MQAEALRDLWVSHAAGVQGGDGGAALGVGQAHVLPVDGEGDGELVDDDVLALGGGVVVVDVVPGERGVPAVLARVRPCTASGALLVGGGLGRGDVPEGVEEGDDGPVTGSGSSPRTPRRAATRW